MEDTTTRGSTTANSFERRVIQPRLIVQALAFTGILYFCVGQAPPETARTFLNPMGTSANLSTAVGNSVLRHASQHSGLPASSLHIAQARPQTWSDNCLGLTDFEASCTLLPVPGWQVAVVSGQRRWIYRTDASGSVIKLEKGTSSPRL